MEVVAPWTWRKTRADGQILMNSFLRITTLKVLLSNGGTLHSISRCGYSVHLKCTLRCALCAKHKKTVYILLPLQLKRKALREK